MSWFDYLDALNEANSYRNRIKTLDSDIGMYLDTGPQKKGSPYKTKRARFKKRKFNDVSAPPSAPGGLEEEVDEDSFEVQDELQPEFWQNNELSPEINKRLVEIVTDFIDNLPVDITVEDIRLTGSLANYNWSEYSDIDIHIIV